MLKRESALEMIQKDDDDDDDVCVCEREREERQNRSKDVRNRDSEQHQRVELFNLQRTGGIHVWTDLKGRVVLVFLHQLVRTLGCNHGLFGRSDPRICCQDGRVDILVGLQCGV